MHDFPERDWKLFRKLHAVALERFCERTLTEVGNVVSESRAAHDRYLDIYKLIQDRDRQLGSVFNDPRRSNALMQIAYMRFHGLLSQDELSQFTAETVRAIPDITRA